MIQRIQTIFLLLAAIISVLLFVFPAEVYTSMDGSEIYAHTMLPFDSSAKASPIIYGLFAATLGVLCLAVVAVFQYKNRKKQLKLSRMLLLLSAMQMGLMFVLNLYDAEAFTKSYTWAAYLPVGTIVFALLAGVFIKKDEELVRSADRIR